MNSLVPLKDFKNPVPSFPYKGAANPKSAIFNT